MLGYQWCNTIRYPYSDHHHNDKNADVTCDSSDAGDHEYKQELKVGTENNQRIVAIKPKGNGSEFAMVYVRAWGNNKKEDTN